MEKRLKGVTVKLVDPSTLPPRREEKPSTNVKIGAESPEGAAMYGAIVDNGYITGYDWEVLSPKDELERARHWLKACHLNLAVAHGRMRAKHGAALRATATGKHTAMKVALREAKDRVKQLESREDERAAA